MHIYETQTKDRTKMKVDYSKLKSKVVRDLQFEVMTVDHDGGGTMLFIKNRQ